MLAFFRRQKVGWGAILGVGMHKKRLAAAKTALLLEKVEPIFGQWATDED